MFNVGDYVKVIHLDMKTLSTEGYMTASFRNSETIEITSIVEHLISCRLPNGVIYTYNRDQLVMASTPKIPGTTYVTPNTKTTINDKEVVHVNAWDVSGTEIPNFELLAENFYNPKQSE